MILAHLTNLLPALKSSTPVASELQNSPPLYAALCLTVLLPTFPYLMHADQQIRQFIEADSLAYLTHDGLIHSCTKGEAAGGLTKNSFCTACYTGNYPTALVDVEEILPAPAVTV